MLIIARHGQTDLNAHGALQGRIDAALNDVGRHQARRLGAVLSGAKAVISSPLIRAHHTALEIRGDVEIDDRWLELDFGNFDGLPLADVPASVWQQWRTNPSFRFGGGETLHEVHERVSAACHELAEVARHDDIVVVSHVSAIKAAVTWALGTTAQSLLRMRLDQASICRIGFGPEGTPTLLSFNETHHLDESRDT